MPEREERSPAAPGGNGKERAAHGPDKTVPRYETTDISAPAMVRWAVGLIVFTALSMVLVLGFYMALRGPVGRPRASAQVERRLPPWPRLQADPVREYVEYRAEQDKEMASYGWVDRERGIVRMPVDRAMELVEKNGLPEWKDSGQNGGAK